MFLVSTLSLPLVINLQFWTRPFWRWCGYEGSGMEGGKLLRVELLTMTPIPLQTSVKCQRSFSSKYVKLVFFLFINRHEVFRLEINMLREIFKCYVYNILACKRVKLISFHVGLLIKLIKLSILKNSILSHTTTYF